MVRKGFFILMFLIPITQISFAQAQSDIKIADKSSSTFDSDIVIRLSYDMQGDIGTRSMKGKTTSGNTIGVELLSDGDFKMIFGAQLSMLKTSLTDKAERMFFAPIYFGFQGYPIDNFGLFARTTLGFDMLSYSKKKSDDKDPDIGGYYFGIGAGYEFKSGLLFTIGWDIYWSKKETKDRFEQSHINFWTYSKTGIYVGYKFGRH